MGAIESLRWQDSHFSWKIGAISLVKVTGASAAKTRPENANKAKGARFPSLMGGLNASKGCMVPVLVNLVHHIRSNAGWRALPIRGTSGMLELAVEFA